MSIAATSASAHLHETTDVSELTVDGVTQDDILARHIPGQAAGRLYERHLLPSTATHIRLLELRVADSAAASEPGAPPLPETIVCSLLTTPIESPQPFKALSYHWGTDDKTCSLEVSGSCVRITPSLDTALRYVATQQETLYLWVDQICINQEDSAEKSDQVLLMTDIYSKAEQVLVWLGETADRSDELMDLWRDIGQQAQSIGLEDYFTKEKVSRMLEIMNSRSVDDPLTEPYHQIVDTARPQFEKLLQAIIDFDQRPWFHRVWIVQEVSLCPNTVFVCGHKTVPVDYVVHTNHIFSTAIKQSLKSGPDMGFQQLALQALSPRTVPLLSTRRRRQRFQNGVGDGDELFHLLRKLFVESDTKATQSRDRIYGLLGLAVDSKDLAIKPDYSTADPALAFTSVARAMIRNGRVELLSFSQFPKEPGLENLPTWVPDWRSNLLPSYYVIFESAEDHLLGASGNTKVSLAPTNEQNILGIRGYIVDSIDEVGSAWDASGGNASCLALFKTLEELCRKSAAVGEPIYPSASRRAEAVWRVPVGDLYWTPETDYIRARKPLVEDQYRDCLAVSEIVVNWGSMSAEEQKPAMQEITSRRFTSGRYKENMSGMNGKKPYVTCRGYLGMCPGSAVAGDVVVILCGARLPYVLRRQDQGDRWTFLGEAYCDGVMDGEIMGHREERLFNIE
ncbi:uncharacterized protein JN550_005872 [Neoarthrinium moseri]|uniref:uncharacterized protein n=1 Tax=Neoarthrinium moseri TaxID=1658444 RepID=UPI001FDD58E9|nr:uncharacterized protein JN550_005872 [Neoarthrinium moseri]KAI1869242.1 hypothetical protein JN550_005872 [Neoarthrinium moseri]